MYRRTAAALAIVGLLAQVGVGYQPLDVYCPPPCGCELPPIVCCDSSAPAAKPSEPRPPAPLPVPADAATDSRPTSPIATSPTPATDSAPDAAAISPPQLETPAPAVAPTTPPAEEPAPSATQPAEEPSPFEPAPRYSAPPQEEPPATDASSYDDVFSDAPNDSESQPPAEQPPATEPAATDEPSTPPPSDEAEPAAEEPSTPSFDELFPPSSSHKILTEPGGWASDASRDWNAANGQLLATGRISSVTARHVVLATGAEQSHAVSYADLADEDLSFLRQQVEARRAQLAERPAADELLATQAQ